jgi:hypothetical protein
VTVAPVAVAKPTAVTLTSTGIGGFADIQGSEPVGQPLVITAAGDLAAGLVASRLTRAASGPDRGYAWDRCTSPVTDGWFTGVSTGAGVSSTLTLVNADDTPADVDVHGLSTQGEVSPSLTAGIQLAPHSSTQVKLADLDPDQDELAVEIEATRGRVAGFVDELRQAGRSQGFDPVPVQVQPASTVVVAGVLGATDGTIIHPSTYHHTLVVGNPSSRDTTVSVEVTDGGRPASSGQAAEPGGRFVPATKVSDAAGTLAQLLVPAGSVTVVPPAVLDGVLKGGPVTLRLKSVDGTPLVAGVRIDGVAQYGTTQQLCTSAPATCYAETVHLGAAPAVVGPTLTTDVRVGPDLDTLLTLTSYADRDARVTVSLSPPGGSNAITVPAGQEVVLALHGFVGTPSGPQVVQIVPDPGSPPIYSAAVVTELGFHGPLLAAIPVTGGAVPVGLSATVPDLTIPLVDARR